MLLTRNIRPFFWSNSIENLMIFLFIHRQTVSVFHVMADAMTKYVHLNSTINWNGLSI